MPRQTQEPGKKEDLSPGEGTAPVLEEQSDFAIGLVALERFKKAEDDRTRPIVDTTSAGAPLRQEVEFIHSEVEEQPRRRTGEDEVTPQHVEDDEAVGAIGLPQTSVSTSAVRVELTEHKMMMIKWMIGIGLGVVGVVIAVLSITNASINTSLSHVRDELLNAVQRIERLGAVRDQRLSNMESHLDSLVTTPRR